MITAKLLTAAGGARAVGRCSAKRSAWPVTPSIVTGIAQVLGLAAAMAADDSTVRDAASSAVLEEILVTASKRGAEDLQKIPVTLQALTGDDLEKMRARNFDDYARLVPGLAFQDQGPGDKRLIIRGINAGGAGTVGVYFDEAVITGGSAEDGGGKNVDLKLSDMERIEVLKGPQGTLYGANSMSGTIRLVTNKPNLDNFEASVEASGSTTSSAGGNYEVAAMVNMPVASDVFGVRLVGWSVSNSGYIDNVRLGNDRINDEQTDGGRLIGRWTPTENLTFTVSALLQNLKVGSNSRWNAALGQFEADDYARTPWDEQTLIYGGTIEYDAGFADIVATANWYDRDIDFRFDITKFLGLFGLNIPAITVEPQEKSVLSSELRLSTKSLGPFQAVVGVYYEDQTRDFENKSVRIDAAGNPTVPVGLDDPIVPSQYIFGRRAHTELEQYAFFGELTYSITERLQALVGLRQFHSDQREEGVTTFPFGGFPPSGPPPANPDDVGSEDKLTKKFGLSFQMTDDHFVYGLVSEGFRPGGLNDRGFLNAPSIPPQFGPDLVRNYEIGLKNGWLDHRLRTNLAVARLDWTDMQTRAVDSVTFLPFITNAGKARVDSVELEIEALPTAGLSLTAAFGYLDAALTEDQPVLPNDPNTGRAGDPIPNVPEWMASAATQFSFPLFAGLTGVVRGDVKYRGSTATAFRTTSPAYLTLADYTVFDFRVGVEGRDWSASLFLENAFDEFAEQDKRVEPYRDVTVYTVRPRTIGLHLKKSF